MNNLLLFDVGNTNTVIAVYNDEQIICKLRIKTDYLRTADEYAAILFAHFNMNKLTFLDIKDLIVSSVVPKVNEALDFLASNYFNKKIMYISTNLNTGLNYAFDDTTRLGADLIAGAVGAYYKYNKDVLIVDLGTATTLTVVNNKGVYLGGIITLGLKTAASALTDSAAKLPNISLESPEKVIGTKTVSAMQSGIVLGYASMIEGLINKIKKELNDETIQVIFTGGQAKYITNLIDLDFIYDDNLLLEGILKIYQMN